MEMKKRLIDANVVYEMGHRTPFHISIADLCDLKELLEDVPTVDAVEVVRCKDCKHYDKDALWCNINSYQFGETNPNWYDDDFCSYGEKMDKAEAQQDCTYNKNGHCIGQKLMPECDAKNCDRRK